MIGKLSMGLAIVLVIMTLSIQSVVAQTHILVQESEYAAWQALANQPGPWATMKADAISTAGSLSYNPGISGFSSKNYRLRDVVTSNALAYILDPADRATYRQNLRDHLLTGLQDITTNNTGSGWSYSVPQGTQVFSSILALDVIRYDPGLSMADLSAIEALMDTAVNQILAPNWAPNGQTVRSLWGLYQGDAADFSSWKNQHDTSLLSHYTPGGVFKPGPNYAAARMSSVISQAKNLYQDVLEIQGYNDYYSNSELQAGHEWIYGYSHSPFGRGLTFGDAVDYSTLYNLSGGLVSNAQILRADRYSEQAGQYAAWQLREGAGLGDGDIGPKGRLITYATMTGPTTGDAVLAPSRLFDSYAGLIDRQQSTDALFAGMLSLTESDGHSHKEANALHLGAYGEHVLRNAGYNGWGTGVGMASWAWINNTAESGNTVVINGADHVSKTSGGIVSGLVGGGLEFARGDSGSALSNGSHVRDMLFVQPGNGVGGYWLVADHVTPNTPGHAVEAFWHPNSAVLQEQTAGEKYLSDISNGPRTYGSNQVKLTTFLATPPQSIQVKQTTLANRASSFDAEYLAASYDSSSGSADALTVFFPHDQSHAVANMTRLSSGQYSGAVISQGSVYDVAFTSDGQTAGSFLDASFQGEDVVYRTTTDGLEWYFIGEGLSFDDGAASRSGFTADADVSMYVEEDGGNIVSSGANVTIYDPGIVSLLINDGLVTPSAQGAGWLSVFIPAGSHKLQFTSLMPTADFDSDGDVDGTDFLAWQRGFGMTTGATVADGDADLDGDVDHFDLQAWEASYGALSGGLVQTIPEPHSVIMLGIALVLATSKRRRPGEKNDSQEVCLLAAGNRPNLLERRCQ